MTRLQQSASILLVDDNPAYLEAYATWLSPEHEVSVAESGTDALTHVDADTDIVILDRRMPDINGEKVAVQIRDRGIDCRIALVTAVEPSFDIIEMEVDEYLSKPITQTELTNLIDQLLSRDQFRSEIQRKFSLVSKKAALETQYTDAELDNNEAYQTLLSELESVEATVTNSIDELLESGQVATAYRDLYHPAPTAQHKPLKQF